MTEKLRQRENVFVAIAKRCNREYITPEDVSNALRDGHLDCIREDLLGVIGEQFDLGVEDIGLCAYIAWRGIPTMNR